MTNIVVEKDAAGVHCVIFSGLECLFPLDPGNTRLLEMMRRIRLGWGL